LKEELTTIVGVPSRVFERLGVDELDKRGARH
jgi:hypothetical protein